MDKQDLIVKMLGDLKDDFKTFSEDNKAEHIKIIKRQDHTNGSVAKIKRGQLILWTALSTSFILLVILGFMPDRIYNIISSIF